MSDTESKAADAATPPKDAGGILTQIAEHLQGRTGGDMDLTEILVTHVLTLTPAKTAAEDAMAAIRSLAKARANPPAPAEAASGE